MIDTERFLQQAITIATNNLPFCDGDTSKAARSAIQEAHVNLGQAQFFAAIDALGGFDAVTQRIIGALEAR